MAPGWLEHRRTGISSDTVKAAASRGTGPSHDSRRTGDSARREVSSLAGKADAALRLRARSLSRRRR